MRENISGTGKAALLPSLVAKKMTLGETIISHITTVT